MSTTHNTVLKAEKRNDLSTASLHKLRASGRVPGVIYGSQVGSLPLHVDEKELIKVSRTGRSEFFQLTLGEGESFPALIKDIQLIKGKVGHVDFQQVSRNRPMRVNIPVHYTGTAEGVKEGGILQTLVLELEVEGLPDALPSGIEVDVSALGVGDKLTAAEVALPDGIILHTSEDTLLASIVMPRGADAGDEVEAPDHPSGAGNAEDKEPAAEAEE